LKVTFDTNALDKAARPGLFPEASNQPDYVKVNAALAAGTLAGHFSETIITLEGIHNKDIFKSTQLRRESEKEAVTGETTTIEIRHLVEQPDRKPLHPQHLNIALALAPPSA
jgi:hypothetical protein